MSTVKCIIIALKSIPDPNYCIPNLFCICKVEREIVGVDRVDLEVPMEVDLISLPCHLYLWELDSSCTALSMDIAGWSMERQQPDWSGLLLTFRDEVKLLIVHDQVPKDADSLQTSVACALRMQHRWA